MVEKAKNGNSIEVAIWINMENDMDYGETLLHICGPSVQDDKLCEVKIHYRV